MTRVDSLCLFATISLEIATGFLCARWRSLAVIGTTASPPPRRRLCRRVIEHRAAATDAGRRALAAFERRRCSSQARSAAIRLALGFALTIAKQHILGSRYCSFVELSWY